MPAPRRTHPPPPLTVSQMAAINADLVACNAQLVADNTRGPARNCRLVSTFREATDYSCPPRRLPMQLQRIVADLAADSKRATFEKWWSKNRKAVLAGQILTSPVNARAEVSHCQEHLT